MFNVFELLQDYEKDRIQNERQNDKEEVLAESL